jgi:uncharacterized membrane protein
MTATADDACQRTAESTSVPTGSPLEAPVGKLTARGGASMVCPACGGINNPDAVFCNNPACHKALGDFRYGLEELRAEAQWHQIIADKVTALIAKPRFVAAHFFWFAVWVILNTGIIAYVKIFDDPPFFYLVTIVAIETIFITIFVLISNSRQSTHDEKRAELDYEVNVLTYREITEMRAIMQHMQDRLEHLEHAMQQGLRGQES